MLQIQKLILFPNNTFKLDLSAEIIVITEIMLHKNIFSFPHSTTEETAKHKLRHNEAYIDTR
jgi:hypothetical protein